jgi:hypothetical protein
MGPLPRDFPGPKYSVSNYLIPSVIVSVCGGTLALCLSLNDLKFFAISIATAVNEEETSNEWPRF